mgnify:CR=1 FL=1
MGEMIIMITGITHRSGENEGETEAISGKFAQNKGKGRKIPDSKNIKNEPKYP